MDEGGGVVGWGRVGVPGMDTAGYVEWLCVCLGLR